MQVFISLGFIEIWRLSDYQQWYQIFKKKSGSARLKVEYSASRHSAVAITLSQSPGNGSIGSIGYDQK